MYLFLGIFPYSRPVDQKLLSLFWCFETSRKNHEIAFFDPKDKRKEEKTLSSPFISLSLSLSPQRDHARESVVPSLSVVVGVGVGVVYVITRFRERKDDCCVSLNYFNQKKKGSSSERSRSRSLPSPPPSCELTTSTKQTLVFVFNFIFTIFTNTNTSKKKQKEGRVICGFGKNNGVGKRNNKRKERKDETKKNANSIFCLVKRKNCLKTSSLSFETIN